MTAIFGFKTPWAWSFILAAGMIASAATVMAENVRITVSGTVTSADAGMGFTVGQAVSFFWEINDFAPTPPSGNVITDFLFFWEDEDVASDPQLFASAGGTGISGTFTRAPDSAPYETIAAFLNGQMNVFSETDGFSSVNNHGIFLTANPTYLIDVLGVSGFIPSAPGFTGFSPIAAPLPNPAAFFAQYAGDYGVASSSSISLDARNPSDLTLLRANFAATGMTIAAVPEPTTCVMALAGLACGGHSLLRRRKRA